MKLSHAQIRHIRFHLDGLLERVRDLRDRSDVSAPADAEMELLFTDGDDYEVTRDRLVDFHLAIIRGIAVGLDLLCPSDLYRIYIEGLDGHRIPDIAELIASTEQALVFLARAYPASSRAIVNDLGRALAPFKGKEWR